MSNERPIEISISREGKFVVGANRGRAIAALSIAVDEYLKTCADRCPVIVFGLNYRPVGITVSIERIFVAEFRWMQIDISGCIPSGLEPKAIAVKPNVTRLFNPDSKSVERWRVRCLVDAFPRGIRSLVEIDPYECLIFVVIHETN
ncbi:hypothetical protein ACERIT_12255 [Halopenitus sp. H-Gu1]|uniref:hypothetical protein n=1 Tax=Halopenitus sp. H-Gu1 TaxID=3242697 RepID=UPI00359DC8CB